jgi:hypothetical protein
LPQNRALGKFKENQVRMVEPALALRAKPLRIGELGAKAKSKGNQKNQNSGRQLAKSRDWRAVYRKDDRRYNPARTAGPQAATGGQFAVEMATGAIKF